MPTIEAHAKQPIHPNSTLKGHRVRTNLEKSQTQLQRQACFTIDALNRGCWLSHAFWNYICIFRCQWEGTNTLKEMKQRQKPQNQQLYPHCRNTYQEGKKNIPLDEIYEWCAKNYLPFTLSQREQDVQEVWDLNLAITIGLGIVWNLATHILNSVMLFNSKLKWFSITIIWGLGSKKTFTCLFHWKNKQKTFSQGVSYFIYSYSQPH